MMKKALVVLLLAAFVVPAFADDALALPQGVWRTRIIPVYSFAENSFDGDFSTSRDSTESQKALALGFAIEYGINDWITAAAQWTPGFVAWSDLESPAGIPAGVTISPNSWFDLFVGAKFQIVGPNAPVVRDDMRFAVATGVKIPFASADWNAEAVNQGSGQDFVGANVDRNVLGIGARLYYDYVFSPSFFVNLYSEFIAYPFPGEAPNLTAHSGSKVGAIVGGDKSDKFEYGYDLALETEPQFIYTASPALRITPSLPVRFQYRPELKLDGEKLSSYNWALGGPALASLADAGPTASLTVAPTVEFFFTGLTVPTALQVAYRFPVAGQNTDATNAVIIQVKNYLKFW